MYRCACLLFVLLIAHPWSGGLVACLLNRLGQKPNQSQARRGKHKTRQVRSRGTWGLSRCMERCAMSFLLLSLTFRQTCGVPSSAEHANQGGGGGGCLDRGLLEISKALHGIHGISNNYLGPWGQRHYPGTVPLLLMSYLLRGWRSTARAWLLNTCVDTCAVARRSINGAMSCDAQCMQLSCSCEMSCVCLYFVQVLETMEPLLTSWICGHPSGTSACIETAESILFRGIYAVLLQGKVARRLGVLFLELVTNSAQGAVSLLHLEIATVHFQMIRMSSRASDNVSHFDEWFQCWVSHPIMSKVALDNYEGEGVVHARVCLCATQPQSYVSVRLAACFVPGSCWCRPLSTWPTHLSSANCVSNFSCRLLWCRHVQKSLWVFLRKCTHTPCIQTCNNYASQIPSQRRCQRT